MSLRKIRESKSFSVYRFASQMGLTTEELINIEEGKKTPRLCLAQKMANALGLSFEDFARHYYEKADPQQLVEGGAKMITSLLKNKLVDRLVITIAPKIIGQGIEAVGELGVKELKEAINFDRIRFKKMGADLIFEGEPVNQTWKV